MQKVINRKINTIAIGQKMEHPLTGTVGTVEALVVQGKGETVVLRYPVGDRMSSSEYPVGEVCVPVKVVKKAPVKKAVVKKRAVKAAPKSPSTAPAKK